MGRIKKWRNVSGTFSFECGQYEDGHWATADDKIKLPDIVVKELKELFPADSYDDCSFEIELPFLSSGYYDPGVLSGPPERCYPPEGEDERTLDGQAIVSYFNEKQTKKLSLPASDELFDLFLDDIQEKELDRDWDESPY